jgi:uncharacterized membrane protein
MHKRHKYDIIVILSVIALSVSLYLSMAKALNLTVPCGITGGCETVLSSKYSAFFGIPLSTWGIAFFFAIIFSALLANHYGLWRKILTVLLSLGGLASLSLLFLQFFVIKKICQYCLITDVLTIIMLIWDINIEHRRPEIGEVEKV